MNVPPFPAGYHASGLLLHVTSLPSPYGIGDLGSTACSWVNCLHDARQRWWQSLPVGPTGYGNSPYQPISSFAGNTLLISPEGLIADGLVKASECEHRFPDGAVDYEAVTEFKRRLLSVAWKAFKFGVRKDLGPAYQEFCRKNRSLAQRLCAVPGAEGEVLQRVLPRMAGGSGKAAAGCHRRGEAGVGGPDRARLVFAIPAVPAGGATQTSRSLERYCD